MEAVQSIAREKFSDLTIGTYGIDASGGAYVLSGTSNTTGIYTRSITIDTVRRDAGGAIVQAGGTIDYDSRLATSTVQWTEGSFPRQVTLASYITNWRKIVPAGLTVQKLVINHGGSKTTADFAPYLVGTGTVNLNEAVTLNPGTYTVSETPHADYTQTFSGNCNALGQVTLASRDAKTCTITNEEKLATITVNKVVSGGSKTTADFAPYTVGATTVTLGSPTTLDSGTYTVSETADANYTTAFSGDCNTSGQVTLTPGTAKTCTITNTYAVSDGTVTVNKVVVNNGGTKTSADFAPYAVGATTVSLGVATSFAPGTYTVTETADANYTTTFSGDCNATGQVTVTVGSAKTCTITNTEKTQGIFIYGNGILEPLFRLYNSIINAFQSAATISSGSAGSTYVLRTSPTRREAIAGYVTAAGVLQILCYDGTSWSNEWSVTVGGTATTRRFDIAYETNTGDAMVLYSRNTGTTNELEYRTKAGSLGCGSANWAAATNLDPVRTTGVVHWVKMAWDRRASSNLITAIWADANADLSAMTWSGTAWGNEPAAATETSLEVVTLAQDVDDFDVEYESVSGDVLVAWANSAGANGTNGVRYRICTGGTAACTWNAVTTPPTFSDDATNLDLSAAPTSDEMILASIGNAGSDLQIGYWSGSAWTNTANADTSAGTPVAGSRLVTTGWLVSGATKRSVVIYNDSNSTKVDWYVGNGSTFTVQTDFNSTPPLNGTQRWFDSDVYPATTDQLMFALSMSPAHIYAKRLVMTSTPAFTWTNADEGAALGTSLVQLISAPFSFAYWRY